MLHISKDKPPLTDKIFSETSLLFCNFKKQQFILKHMTDPVDIEFMLDFEKGTECSVGCYFCQLIVSILFTSLVNLSRNERELAI